MKMKKLVDLNPGDKFYDSHFTLYEVVSKSPVVVEGDSLVRLEAKRVWNCPDTMIVVTEL